MKMKVLLLCMMITRCAAGLSTILYHFVPMVEISECRNLCGNSSIREQVKSYQSDEWFGIFEKGACGTEYILCSVGQS